MAKALQESIPGAKPVVFPSSGHMIFVDPPDMFLEPIIGFLHSAKH
jgi:pimeloyl-ACP methyl ester carboxylesterase